MYAGEGPNYPRSTEITTSVRIITSNKGERINTMSIRFLKAEAYVDASFADHEDGKSHTGIVLIIGHVSVLCASTKQKSNRSRVGQFIR
jgi:hypothetical protein